MSMHGANGKGKRKQKGHLAFQVPFLHVLARSHENGTNGGLTLNVESGGALNLLGSQPGIFVTLTGEVSGKGRINIGKNVALQGF